MRTRTGAVEPSAPARLDGHGTAPLAGEDNICAAPLLADEGNPASFDVHESEAGPTIDTGSNALLPSGLGTDLYGNPRIAASAKPRGCEAPTALWPATVDMGADEYIGTVIRGPAPPCLAPPPPPPPPPPLSSFAFPKITQLTRGAIKLTFAVIGAGKLSVTAKFTLARFVTVRVRGRKVHRRKTETASGHRSTTEAKTFADVYKPARRKKHHS